VQLRSWNASVQAPPARGAMAIKSTLPGVALLQSAQSDGTVRDLGMAVMKIVLFVILGFILYSRAVGINAPDIDEMGPGWTWNFVECFYFTMATLTTIGYGDMPTLPQHMRLITIVFGLGGVLVVADAIGVIAEWFVVRARKRFHGRQRQVLREAEVAGRLVAAAKGKGGDEGGGDDDKGAALDAKPAAEGKAAGGSCRRGLSATVARVAPEPNGAAEAAPPDTLDSHVVSAPAAATTSSTACAPAPAAEGEGGRASMGDRARGWAANACSKSSRAFYREVMKAGSPCALFVVLCIALGEVENAEAGCASAFNPDGQTGDSCWTLIDAIYFSVITLTTIGYGDVSPASGVGRTLMALLMPMAIFSLSSFISQFHQLREARRMGAEKTLRQRLHELIEVIEADADGIVSPEEYIIFSLRKMGKVDGDTITLLREQFKALDADKSGSLDASDIGLLTDACDQIEQDPQLLQAA